MTAAKALMTVDAVGGVWRYAMDLGRGLAGEGVGVVFAGLGPAPSPAARREAAAIGTLEWGSAPLDWMAAGEADLDGVGPWLADVARRHGVTHLHLNLPSQAANLPEALAGLPVITVCHSCLATWFAAVRGGLVPADLAWHPALTARGLARADAIVAPSRSHADAVRRCYGPGLAIEVVPNAVRAEAAAGPRSTCIVAVGRWWDAGKNVAVLDDVAADLAWPCLLIGPTRGPDGTEVAIAHAEVAGERPHDEARRLIASAGIFVSPSRYEPFGLAVLEAAQGGAPLVLSDIPTFRELWDGAALFFPKGDSLALLFLLTHLIHAPELREELGAAARERAARYAPAAQIASMLGLYRRVAVRKPFPLTME